MRPSSYPDYQRAPLSLRNQVLCLSPLPLWCMLGNMHVACFMRNLRQHECDWECLTLDSAAEELHITVQICWRFMITSPNPRSHSCFVIWSIYLTNSTNKTALGRVSSTWEFAGPNSEAGSELKLLQELEQGTHFPPTSFLPCLILLSHAFYSLVSRNPVLAGGISTVHPYSK